MNSRESSRNFYYNSTSMDMYVLYFTSGRSACGLARTVSVGSQNRNEDTELCCYVVALIHGVQDPGTSWDIYVPLAIYHNTRGTSGT